MTVDEELERLRYAKMSDSELVEMSAPYHNQLTKQGEMRDNDTIDDKQLKIAQQPVTSAANAIIKLRLAQEQYRAKWDYKDDYKSDKWAHKDKVREMKRKRRELVKARKAARKAEKAAKRVQVNTASCENTPQSESKQHGQNHTGK